MPHCIVEYSKGITQSLDINKLVELVHQTTFDSGLFEIDDIKTRAVQYDHYMVGYGHSESIHVVIKVMPGRSIDVRKTLSLSIAQVLSELTLPATSITVQIEEIDKTTYSKIVC